MSVPMLVDIPFRFETERLLIRGPLPGDGRELNAAINESMADLLRWMEWAPVHTSVAVSEENVRRAHVDWLARTSLRLQLYLLGTDTLVGCSGFHDINWDVPRFEIGYWCRTRFVGQGYVTEAVRGITRYAFDVLSANRLQIRCDPTNVRSIRVIERIGFRREGTLRNEALSPSGELRDTHIYAMIPEEFAALDLPPIRLDGV